MEVGFYSIVAEVSDFEPLYTRGDIPFRGGISPFESL
jgi:hypothetical protein|tara:strand:- start:92 stop:202 length:111 start_codon:yes stop_codon:yes gene_type:complete